MDRLGLVVVCSGSKDRLLHDPKWCVSPPFLSRDGYVLEKESNIGYAKLIGLGTACQGTLKTG